MGKENKEYKKGNLEQLRAAIKKQEQIIAMRCNHQKKNGDLNVRWINEQDGLVECKTCGDRFSMAIFDDKELKKAYNTLHSAIQQIRATTNDDEGDIVENFGKVDYALRQIPEKYTNLIDALAKGKKKKKNKGKKNNIGGYGDALQVVRKNRGR